MKHEYFLSIANHPPIQLYLSQAMNSLPKELRPLVLSFVPWRPKSKEDIRRAMREVCDAETYEESQRAFKIYGPIFSWDTCCMTDMSFLFADDEYFNYDISKWNVSSVKNFRGMFQGCRVFNGDLSKWNVENGEDFSHMFDGCRKFSKSIADWKPKKAKNMCYMLAETNYKGDLDNWSKYVDMSIPMTGIFLDAGITMSWRWRY